MFVRVSGYVGPEKLLRDSFRRPEAGRALALRLGDKPESPFQIISGIITFLLALRVLLDTQVA